jgi:hypothetical protein
VPYLLLGLQDVQWAVGNSRGACKLARTPHVNKKKKIKKKIVTNCQKQADDNQIKLMPFGELEFRTISMKGLGS